jgi:hypothetical protein
MAATDYGREGIERQVGLADEHEVLDPEPAPREQRDQILVTAARPPEQAEAARQSPFEAVSSDREVRAEAPVDEVAPEAVAEPAVLDGHVRRPPEEDEAERVRRQIPVTDSRSRRPVAAVRERAPPDRDIA